MVAKITAPAFIRMFGAKIVRCFFNNNYDNKLNDIMKNNFRNIAILIFSLLLAYILVATYLVYDDYKVSLNQTIRTSDRYSQYKSDEISSYLNSSVQTTSTIGNMLASAREKYGYDLIPYVEQSLQTLCIENPQFASITVTWEFSAVCKTWSRPYGRLIMKAYMLDASQKTPWTSKAST